ncbi:hypothetical protein [Flavobacterium lipolyticum]|uniref:Carboxypeptidase-like regulatory domain-containing protein n=1 Tax=Flavobacterium lipolyticum TaxID=2893754 RepID=A0ABS8M015_9FLAO|nr:hypothetical protein [Flavobacterium sp. F-126]MCC9018140.1 hypothetical protein [Flavobacterium sp. F-126]
MKVKLLTTISFFTYQLSISQTEKLLKGKVQSETILLKNIEVINKTAQTSTTTNHLGEFSILAKAQDSLIFFSKNFLFKRIKLTAKEIESNMIIINMIPITEELDNIVIINNKLPKITYSVEAANQVKNDKQANDLIQRYLNINDGRIKNALNYNIALPTKKKKKIENDERFKKLVAASCPPGFFTNDLKLKPEEKEIFIKFCDVDPKSKMLLQDPNILTTMDFLYIKNIEFQKLKTDPKN